MIRSQFPVPDKHSFMILYKGFVWPPHLEHAIQAWSSYLRKEIRYRKNPRQYRSASVNIVWQYDINLKHGGFLWLYINFANETHPRVAFFIIPPIITTTPEIHACFSASLIIRLVSTPVGVRHRLICRLHPPHEPRLRSRIYTLSRCPEEKSVWSCFVASVESFPWKYPAFIDHWCVVHIVWVLLLPTIGVGDCGQPPPK